MTTPLPPALPIGTPYYSKVFHGLMKTKRVGTLTYMWGAKGTGGMDPQPFYCIPVLGGNACEWVPFDAICVI